MSLTNCILRVKAPKKSRFLSPNRDCRMLLLSVESRKPEICRGSCHWERLAVGGLTGVIKTGPGRESTPPTTRAKLNMKVWILGSSSGGGGEFFGRAIPSTQNLRRGNCSCWAKRIWCLSLPHLNLSLSILLPTKSTFPAHTPWRASCPGVRIHLWCQSGFHSLPEFPQWVCWCCVQWATVQALMVSSHFTPLGCGHLWVSCFINLPLLDKQTSWGSWGISPSLFWVDALSAIVSSSTQEVKLQNKTCRDSGRMTNLVAEMDHTRPRQAALRLHCTRLQVTLLSYLNQLQQKGMQSSQVP